MTAPHQRLGHGCSARDLRARHAGCSVSQSVAATRMRSRLVPLPRWSSRISSSGGIGASYVRPVRSASFTSVRLRIAPSGMRWLSLPVGTPCVLSPNDLVCGRPRKATAIASPELAVLRLVSTATGEWPSPTEGPDPKSRSYPSKCGTRLRTVQAVFLPSASTNAQTLPSPNTGAATASIGAMFPPVLSRRSITQPQAPVPWALTTAALPCCTYRSMVLSDPTTRGRDT